jgi:hypothetical protein
MYQVPEIDQEEEKRVRKALANCDRILAERLVSATRPGSFERQFLERDPDTYDGFDRRLLKSLAWHYRRQLPSWLRPKLNPDDPIVRMMEPSNAQ